MLDQDYNVVLLNQPIDVEKEFASYENVYYPAESVEEFDKRKQRGVIHCSRNGRKARMAFNDGRLPFEESQAWEFPPHYGMGKRMPFFVDLINERVVRIRVQGNLQKDFADKDASVILSEKVTAQNQWKAEETEESVRYSWEKGSLEVRYQPFHLILKDEKGKVLLKTNHPKNSCALLNCDPFPFGAVEKIRDTKTCLAASFQLFPEEKLFGCGESFTRLDKRGQKLVLYTKDPHGVQTPNMYKPIPFYLSNRGYGIFYHTSAPVTLDLGRTYDGAQVAYLGDDMLEMYVMIGSPKEIVESYTGLTGRAPMLPEWTFGLWMSRISYFSQDEVEKVAERMEEEKLPLSVIHLDTGWFAEDWKCDFRFSEERFPDRKGMYEKLKEKGIHISLWQYPYFTPENRCFAEAKEKGYGVKGLDGGLATKDVVVDMSNPEAVKWYQEKLRRLLEEGADCIKADFGEAAPVNGLYASGKSGFYEHNMYPLRYNKAVAEIVGEVKGAPVIWARSAWAGSQRYPVHWGGDSENTLSAMRATLRGALSLGLCGFTFYSHDIGGFVKRPEEKLYRRWLPFGMLTSHARCHGAPPREPWEYGESFTEYFRECLQLREELMGYLLEEAKKACAHGYPMMRPLFFECPQDPGAWLVEDEYFFGEKLLAAPLFEEEPERDLYLPEGTYEDYFTGEVLTGGRWYHKRAGRLEILLYKKL